jgi:tRNA nucleotidyltransferase/poly(A) polymerase
MTPSATAGSAEPRISPLLEDVRRVLPPDQPVYLVGGALRDAMLGRPVHDLDFVLPQGALQAARRVADALAGAYYPLDVERETGRVILQPPDGERVALDFATFQGPDLESDLRARDFTVNALALEVNRQRPLIDPLDGAADLIAKTLRTCSPEALRNDPLRILRGVRLAASLEFHLLPETRAQMRAAVRLLPRVSVERQRDELFRLLECKRPVAALRALERLGALAYVLPELAALPGVTQSPPHVNDVWEHTLDVVEHLERVLQVLAQTHDPDKAANLHLGLVSLRLGRFRAPLAAHLGSALNADRGLRPLLALAALYHDAAKPLTRRVESSGQVRFFEHELLGASLVYERAQALHLSNAEALRLRSIVRHHMRPLLLAKDGPPGRRAVYRFYRDTGPAGVDICLLALADTLATYGPRLTVETWENLVEVVRVLLQAWWEHPAENVSPAPLLNGNDLIAFFDLHPGPQIGQLLELLREAQATGQVHDRPQALDFIRQWLVDHP